MCDCGMKGEVGRMDTAANDDEAAANEAEDEVVDVFNSESVC